VLVLHLVEQVALRHQVVQPPAQVDRFELGDELQRGPRPAV